MRTSKLLLSSLLAAAAMSAVPAYGFSKVTVATTDGVAIVTNTSSQTSQDTIYLNAEEADSNITSYVFNLSGGFFSATAGGSAGTNNRTQRITKDVVIQKLTINNGYSNSYAEFAGAVSGSGNIAITAANGQDLLFTGDASQFSGNITYSGALFETGGNQDLGSYAGTLGETGNKNVGIIQFGGAKAYDSAGTTAVSKTAISGTGEISTASVLRYNFAAESDGAALTVTNSSISARYLEFKGGANYTVSSAVTGKNTTAANNTLTISAGTTTFTGAVSNFGNVTVASGATLAVVGTDGSLDLSGATVSLASAIQNSGTVTISGTTVFALDNLTATNGTYSLVTGNSVTDVSGVSFMRDGAVIKSSRLSVSTTNGYAVTVTNYSDLVWAGTTGNSAWNKTAENWSSTTAGGLVAFENGDSVTFGTGTDNNVTLAENLKVGTLTISAATTLSVADGSTALVTTGTLSLGANLKLNKGVTLKMTQTATGSDNVTNMFRNVTGTGTLSIILPNSNGLGVNAPDFAGTLYIQKPSGSDSRLQLTSTTLGDGALIELADGADLVLHAAMPSFSHDIKINGETELYFNSSSSNSVEFSGDITGAGTLSIASNTNTRTLVLSGNVVLGGLSVSATNSSYKSLTISGAGTVISDLRISAGTLTMDAGQATIKGSQSLSGNLTINDGATVYVAENDSLNYGGTNTVTVNQGGVLDFGNYRWTVGQNNKIVINGGEISGAGQGSNGALDFYEANAAAVTARAGSTSTISAAIRLRGVAATFTVEGGANLTLSGLINGGGTLVKAGNGELIVSGANTYTVGTTIRGGVLAVKNASALGTTAGTTTVNSGGVLKVAVNGGVTAGTVTLDEGARLAIDLTAMTVVEDTALTIISSSAISFNSISAGDMSSNDIEAYFSASDSNLGDWADYLRTWSYEAGTGLQLTLTIPEPSMFGLLAGLGALALAGTRRRRRKA